MNKMNLFLVGLVIAASAQASAFMKCESLEKNIDGTSTFQIKVMGPSNLFPNVQVELVEDATGEYAGLTLICKSQADSKSYVCGDAGSTLMLTLSETATTADIYSTDLDLDVRGMACSN